MNRSQLLTLILLFGFLISVSPVSGEVGILPEGGPPIDVPYPDRVNDMIAIVEDQLNQCILILGDSHVAPQTEEYNAILRIPGQDDRILTTTVRGFAENLILPFPVLFFARGGTTATQINPLFQYSPTGELRTQEFLEVLDEAHAIGCNDISILFSLGINDAANGASSSEIINSISEILISINSEISRRDMTISNISFLMPPHLDAQSEFVKALEINVADTNITIVDVKQGIEDHILPMLTSMNINNGVIDAENLRQSEGMRYNDDGIHMCNDLARLVASTYSQNLGEFIAMVDRARGSDEVRVISGLGN